MTETKKGRIILKAKEILANNREGVRFTELVNTLQKEFPGEAYGNFTGAIWDLDIKFPDEIYKPSRGLFRLAKFKTTETATVPAEPVKKITISKVREDEFYQPFADWLKFELVECTEAIPLGGNFYKEKWGTPDVFGIFKAGEYDIVKPPLEVIAAEVKIDSNQLITAFGQACAYKLFAHKSYLVIPRDASKEDIDRLDALCIICGIGLILFDASKPNMPNFQIRVRAVKHEPDVFYVNKYVGPLAVELGLSGTKRAKRADRAKFEAAMAKVADVEPADERDRL